MTKNFLDISELSIELDFLNKKNGKPANHILRFWEKEFKNQIVDKKRIKKILSNIKIKSQNKKIDIKITREIWKAMIRAYIKYEYRNFKK